MIGGRHAACPDTDSRCAHGDDVNCPALGPLPDAAQRLHMALDKVWKNTNQSDEALDGIVECRAIANALLSERGMPTEPTHEMIVAMHKAMWDEGEPKPGTIGYEHWKQIYGAALAAHRHRNAEDK